jgi:hypothetical protein
LFLGASQSFRAVNIVFTDATLPERNMLTASPSGGVPSAGSIGTCGHSRREPDGAAIDQAQTRSYTRRSEPVAQPVEHLTFNQGVVGSSPTGLAKQNQRLTDVPQDIQTAKNRPGKRPVSRAEEPTPDLSLPLAHPITLTGGPRSHLVTLMDAAILIRELEPFRQARPVWDRAAEMILLASSSREAPDVAEATRQLRVALNHENWLKN